MSLLSPRIGRFAPTPSGHLHFGSLVAALASFLDARASGARWLLRMEDLDPPREVPGAAAAILRALENYGFEWDGPVLYQSQRSAAYAEVVEQLIKRDLAYACSCSRSQLAGHAIYPGTCRHAGRSRHDAAIRLRVPDADFAFIDRVQGHYSRNLAREDGDFIIQRRDGLFAYQLAVVVDDAFQGVTDVVRGADLLDSTPRQLYLQQLLGLPHPAYLHVPLLLQPDGHKLGKSYRSPPLPPDQATPLLTRALRALGQQPPPELAQATPAEIMVWGGAHWDAGAIPRQTSMAEAAIL